jgi:hypothetical protein
MPQNENNEVKRYFLKTSKVLQVKVLQKKFTLLHAHFSKIVLKYSNEVHLFRYLTPLQLETRTVCLVTYFEDSGMPEFMITSIQKWDTGFSDGILEFSIRGVTIGLLQWGMARFWGWGSHLP